MGAMLTRLFWKSRPRIHTDLTRTHSLAMLAAEAQNTYPCLAVTISPDGTDALECKLWKDGALGRNMRLKPGVHAFVKAGDPFLRVSLHTDEFGYVSGHPHLVDRSETNVMYAGEVEFDDNGKVTRWNN